MSEEALSPSEAKVKFQKIADSDFAEKLQQEEFSVLRGANVSTSQTRHQNVTVGAKVALQEDTINKIVETERLKREEMDRTLASKLQDTKETAGVQTWISRELIGFNHTKTRMQELRGDEQVAQQIQDEEVAAVLQEKEDRKLANQMEETALKDEASVKLARSLSKPILETNQLPFTRSGSGSMGQLPRSAQDQSYASRSRTLGGKTDSPVLNQKPRPVIGKKSTSLQTVIPDAREVLKVGSVPPVGHPFLQTPADQQLFREREMCLDGQSDPADSARPDPPAYSRIDQSIPAVPAQTETVESDQSEGSIQLEATADVISVPDQSADEPSEPTPVPPPPFSGVSPSKLRHNKKKK